MFLEDPSVQVVQVSVVDFETWWPWKNPEFPEDPSVLRGPFCLGETKYPWWIPLSWWAPLSLVNPGTPGGSWCSMVDPVSLVDTGIHKGPQ